MGPPAECLVRYMCLIKVHPNEQFGIDLDRDPDLRIIKSFKNMPSLKVNREVNFAHIELNFGKDKLSNISYVFSYLICRSLTISDKIRVLS